MKTVWLLVVSGILVWLFTSCMEAEPAEISVRTTLNGRPQGCTVQVWNSKGVQITEATGDGNGVAYVKSLPPGTYTLKFVNHQGEPYDAEISITVQPNDSQMRQVELSDPTGGLSSS